MKNTKRGLSLFFALVLMLTSVGIGLSTGTLKSEVPEVEAVSKADASPITFYVPETIYLTPHLTSATTFQYYVDSTTAGVLNTSNNKTTGQIYFNCAQASGNNVTISCSGATGITYDTGTVNATTFSRNITAGTLSTGLAQGAVSTLTWTASYTVGGKAMTAKAYTVCYAPQVQVVAAAVRTKNNDGASDPLKAFLQGWAYISGVHGCEPGGTYKANTTGTHILNPMEGDVYSTATDTNAGFWFTATTDGWSRFEDKADGGNVFIQQAVSPSGRLTVDTSRYTDINQIPNLRCGFAMTDLERMQDSYIRYASNFSDTVSGWEYGNYFTKTDNTVDDMIKNQVGPYIFGYDGTPEQSMIRGTYYGGSSGGDMWSQSIATYDRVRLKWAGMANNDGEYNAISCLVNVDLIKVDKAALRTAVTTAVNSGLQKADYPASAAEYFAIYENEVKLAAERLGNPTNSTNVSNQIEFRRSLIGPKTTYKANITHTATDGAFTVNDPELTFNSGDVVTAGQNTYTGYTVVAPATMTWLNQRAAVAHTFQYDPIESVVTFNPGTGGSVSPTTSTVKYNATYGDGTGGWPTPTRAGYDFLGWNTVADGTGTTIVTGTTVAITTAQTLYAQWERGLVTITFDSAGGSAVEPITQNYNTAVTPPANPKKSGYVFTGWLPAVPALMPGTPLTVVAQWTQVTPTFDGDDLVVNIEGWRANYKYQIWTYQRIKSDDLLNTSASVMTNQWIMVQPYTPGSDGTTGANGTIDFTVVGGALLESPNKNYTIAVRIVDENGKYVGEIRQAFTPAIVQEAQITKVLVDGEYVRGSSQEDRDLNIMSAPVIREIKTGAEVEIKVEGNLPSMTYTATVVETGQWITGTGNTFTWNIGALEPRGYRVKVTASNGTSTDTWNVPFTLYDIPASTSYGYINSMTISTPTVGNASQPIFVNADMGNGNFYFYRNEAGRAPIAKSNIYNSTQASAGIGQTINGFGIYRIYAFANRSNISPFGAYHDDAHVKEVEVKRAAGTSSASLAADVNLNSTNKGVKITFTAGSDIAGIGATPVEYSFWRNDAGSYRLVKDWSTDNTLEWIPGRVGRYTIEVRAKGVDAGSYEAVQYVRVNVVGTETIAQNVTITVNETELASAKAWTPIVVKASATCDGSSKDLLYKFNVGELNFDTQTRQNYSANQEFVWTPKKAGTYTIDVLVKNEDSFGSSDALKRITVTVQ